MENFIVSTIVFSKLVQIVFTSYLFGYYKRLPFMNNIFMCVSFFLTLITILLLFSLHTFLWAAGAYMNPRRFSLFVHSNNDGFQPNLVQHFPHVCSTCHSVFSLKKTLECVCERLLHCRLIFSMTWTPGK